MGLKTQSLIYFWHAYLTMLNSGLLSPLILRLMFKGQAWHTNINSLINCSALNHDCSIGEYFCYKIGTNILIFSLTVNTIFYKDYFCSYYQSQSDFYFHCCYFNLLVVVYVSLFQTNQQYMVGQRAYLNQKLLRLA